MSLVDICIAIGINRERLLQDGFVLRADIPHTKLVVSAVAVAISDQLHQAQGAQF